MKAAGVTGFDLDRASGLESDTFSLKGNLRENSSAGLVDTEAAVLLDLMDDGACSFDEARLLLTRKKMLAANIDPDTGLPMDPKAVSSLPPKGAS